MKMIDQDELREFARGKAKRVVLYVSDGSVKILTEEHEIIGLEKDHPKLLEKIKFYTHKDTKYLKTGWMSKPTQLSENDFFKEIERWERR